MPGRSVDTDPPNIRCGGLAGHVDWRVVDDTGEMFRWGYDGSDLIAEWVGILTLRATRSGELKAIEPAPGAPLEIVEKARHGAAVAFLRAHRRQHSLHASSVSWNGQALVCIGESGAGKSTLADQLCRRSGAEILADDVAAIDRLPDGWQVLPSEARLWLHTEGVGAKKPVSAAGIARSPAVLRWIVFLTFNEAASVVNLCELRGADAASALLRSFVRFDWSPDVLERELSVVSALVSQARVLTVERSHDVQADMVADAVAALASEEAR